MRRGRTSACVKQQRGLYLIGSAERICKHTRHHIRYRRNRAGSQHHLCARCPSDSINPFVRGAAPQLGQVRSDVCITQPALDRRP